MTFYSTLLTSSSMALPHTVEIRVGSPSRAGTGPDVVPENYVQPTFTSGPLASRDKWLISLWLSLPGKKKEKKSTASMHLPFESAEMTIRCGLICILHTFWSAHPFLLASVCFSRFLLFLPIHAKTIRKSQIPQSKRITCIYINMTEDVESQMTALMQEHWTQLFPDENKRIKMTSGPFACFLMWVFRLSCILQGVWREQS